MLDRLQRAATPIPVANGISIVFSKIVRKWNVWHLQQKVLVGTRFEIRYDAQVTNTASLSAISDRSATVHNQQLMRSSTSNRVQVPTSCLHITAYASAPMNAIGA